MPSFKLHSEFTPKGDQPKAIESLVRGVRQGKPHQVLLGVTGSGKTFTMAHTIEQVQKPTLVIVHNKTLAAQLYREFKDFFPENAVEYFVSYYDYYQPEAYLPQTDTYIAKDAAINDAIDRMRHAATRALFERNDIVIVASVSCIYGLGSPEAYHEMLVYLVEGMEIERDKVLKKLVEIQYERNDFDFHRGTFRVRGDRIEIYPASSEDRSIRVEFLGDTVEAIYEVDPLLGSVIQRLPKIAVYPGSHYVTPSDRIDVARAGIESELDHRIQYFRQHNMLVEAQRIEQRTLFDLEMIREIGYCHGIENYSRHLSGRAAGEPPPTLLDYFPSNYLVMIDESHVTLPQISGMQKGDHARKSHLIDYGFRLPSAYDNRPLTGLEFEQQVKQVIYVSATPGLDEQQKAEGRVIEQVIRPTGLIDPNVFVRPAKGQVDDLLAEIHARVEKSERTLITTLTKRMAEDLTDYYHELGLKVRYLHSDIKTIERTEIIRDFRMGIFDVLIGINLLREGLDLPEVSLVAIFDADREGYLRSYRSLIQTAGRAARHLSGSVILYAETTTQSMRLMIDETTRRRVIQQAYNLENGVTPTSIRRKIPEALQRQEVPNVSLSIAEEKEAYLSEEERMRLIGKLKGKMLTAAKQLEFEEAADLRDHIRRLEAEGLGVR